MKLKFIELNEEHLEQVRAWRMLPEITKYMYTDPIITKESQLKWFHSIRYDESNRNWVVSVDGVLIGFVNLKISWKNKRGFWAYYIGNPDYIGKGIGVQIELNILRYVFDILNLNKLECEVFQFNNRVVRIHQKCGSKIEGTLRHHVIKNEGLENIICMGILKSEWDLIKDDFDINIAEIEYDEPILAIDYANY